MRSHDTDWSALRHAYGGAGDIPALLRALRDPATAPAAIDTLWRTVVHQGTRYTATPPTASAVLSLLAEGVCPPALLGLLVGMLAGQHTLLVGGAWCDGRRLKRWWDDAPSTDFSPDEAIGDGCTPALLADTWRRVAASLPTLLPLLSAPDPDTRSAAALVCRLMIEEPGVAAALRERLAEEPVGTVRADLCAALSAVEPLDPWLSDPDPACRLVAAACQPHLSGADAVLVAALSGAPASLGGVCVADGCTPQALAASVLRRGPRARLLAAVPALRAALPALSVWDAHEVVCALLAAAFPQPRSGALGTLQREVLWVLVAAEAPWGVAGIDERLETLGLPVTRRGAAALLGFPEPDGDDALVGYGLALWDAGLDGVALEVWGEAWRSRRQGRAFGGHPRGREALRRYARWLSRIEAPDADAVWEVARRGG